jgi:type II secretory pathway pseudopilin PulG
MTSSFRKAFTLVELLIALTLAMFAGGLALSLLARQQRLYRSLDDMLDVREHLRDASDILAASLRTASPTGDTIRLATDTAIELFSTIGASMLCSAPSGQHILLPPDTLANGNVLTAWLSTPDTGDYALVFRDSTMQYPTPGWERFRIMDVTTLPVASLCPPSSHLTTQADINANAHAYQVMLTTSPSTYIRAGAPVRFVRRARYSVYQASDHKWYLGYRRCNAVDGICGIVQPVSGPYQNRGGAPITFRYYRSDGTELLSSGPTTQIARVDIIVRGESMNPLQIPGFSRVLLSDSAITTIAFRNR